jgi:hypothetical protein
MTQEYSEEISMMLREFHKKLKDDFEWSAPILLQAAKQIEKLEKQVAVLKVQSDATASAIDNCPHENEMHKCKEKSGWQEWERQEWERVDVRLGSRSECCTSNQNHKQI